MPLVLTTQRADWQRRQPCRAGRERAVSSGGWGAASGGSGPASRTGLRREPGARASGARAGQPSVSARPGPRPGSPSPSPCPGELRAGRQLPQSERPGLSEGNSSGGRGEGRWSGRAGRSRAGRRAMEERRGSGQPNPESQARLRSGGARGPRGPGSTSRAEGPMNARTRSPAAPARDARPPRYPEVCPSLLGLIVLARFLSPSPSPAVSPSVRSGSAPSPSFPPSLPFSLPSSSRALPPSLPPLSPLWAPLSHPHFLSHTRTQTHSPSLRSLPRFPSLPLSLSLLHALQPFKMLPLPCDSPDAAPRPPARSPAPSLARFLSLALPLPTSDLLH